MSKATCIDCGNNPLPHSLLYLAQTWMYLSAKMPHTKHKNTKNAFLKTVERILETAKIIQWKSTYKSTSMRTKVLLEAAQALDRVRIEQQYVFGNPTEIIRYAVDNGAWHEYFLMPTPYDNPRVRSQLNNKKSTKDLLQQLQIPTPNGFVCHTRKQLSKNLKKLQFPVIVKPAQGSRGRHSHVNLNNEQEVVMAFLNAKKICAYVICEEMLQGSVYRFTTVHEKTAAVLRGDFPAVTGDGKSTIRQLIENKNKLQISGINEVAINRDLKIFLKRQNRTIATIPKKNESIQLGQKIGVRYGGDAVEVTPEVDISFLDAIHKAAQVLPLFILGFDVIAEDIRKPANTQKWGIIEINTTPFIDLHHFPRQGEPVYVASTVWDSIIQMAQE